MTSLCGLPETAKPSKPGIAGAAPGISLALGGGGARGLAHIGVLQVLERAGVAPGFIAGTSMGGLIGALLGSGLRTAEILRLARRFRFPRWFLPGSLVAWERLFPAVANTLPRSFDQLRTRLALCAVDLEEGCQVVLDRGDLLPAVRASCAIPGVLPPEPIDGRWLVDGGVVNVVPVDLAWIADPDVVVAVRIGGPRVRRMPQLGWRVTRMLSRLGAAMPNPGTAKMSLEVLTRAVEISLEHQASLCAAMTDPELWIEPDLGSMGLRDFDCLDAAVAAGRRAAQEALPELHRLLAREPRPSADRVGHTEYCRDPVCSMIVPPQRARATSEHRGVRYHFCSVNCRDRFVRGPGRYLRGVDQTEGPPVPDQAADDPAWLTGRVVRGQRYSPPSPGPEGSRPPHRKP